MKPRSFVINFYIIKGKSFLHHLAHDDCVMAQRIREKEPSLSCRMLRGNLEQEKGRKRIIMHFVGREKENELFSAFSCNINEMKDYVLAKNA